MAERSYGDTIVRRLDLCARHLSSAHLPMPYSLPHPSPTPSHPPTTQPPPPSPSPPLQFLLNCLRNLPMDPAERDANLAALTQQFETRFLGLPARAPTPKAAAAPAAAAAAFVATQRAEPLVPQQAEQAPQQPEVAAEAVAAAGPPAVAAAVIPAAAADPDAAVVPASSSAVEQAEPQSAAATHDVQQPAAAAGVQVVEAAAAAAAMPPSHRGAEQPAAASSPQQQREQEGVNLPPADDAPFEPAAPGDAWPVQPLPPVREQPLEGQDSKASSVGDMLRSQSGLPEELEDEGDGQQIAVQQQQHAAPGDGAVAAELRPDAELPGAGPIGGSSTDQVAAQLL